MTTPPTTAEDRRLLLAGGVLLLGLFADGWAHTNVVDELESFLTPYHAVIFGGFALTAAAVLAAAAARRGPGVGLWAATPSAYRPALVGVLGFAIGFTGDGIWHTVLGIESGVDALLSPTHLLMAVSIAAVLSAPLRSDAARARAADEPVSWLVVASITSVGLVVSFFLMYVWATASGVLTVGPGDSLVEAAGLMQTLLTTAIMVSMAGAVMRRGTPPVGGLLVPLVLVPTAQHGIVDMEYPSLLIAFLVGAVAIEVAVHRGDAGPDVAGVVWAFATWVTSWILIATVEGGTTWSPELVSGQVVIGCLAAWWVGRRHRPSSRQLVMQAADGSVTPATSTAGASARWPARRHEVAP